MLKFDRRRITIGFLRSLFVISAANPQKEMPDNASAAAGG
jgi:hypothetical protein